MKTDLLIIGAGASGLMAAIAAARQWEGSCSRPEITVVERMDMPGKKLLATGNGRCNYTNQRMDVQCFFGEDQRLIPHILKSFGTADVLNFFQELGIYPKDRDGYVYPNSDQARAVLDVLLMEADRLGVRILTGCHVHMLQFQGPGHFTVLMKETASLKEASRTKDKSQAKKSLPTRKIKAKRVILSAGGCAYPNLGSDGSGYALARDVGHQVITPVPALTGLYASEKFFKQLAGVRCQGTIALYLNKRLLAKDTGELQLTDYGISGIPAFQVSRFASVVLARSPEMTTPAQSHKNTEKVSLTAVLDFMPQLTQKQMFLMLKERVDLRPQKTIAQMLTGLLNDKLGRVLIRQAGLLPDSICHTLSSRELEMLSKAIKALEVHITGTGDFSRAQVCAGGVRMNEITPSLESARIPGLYITGELLDVDGICGGYNLHWAWATGYIAGSHAGKDLHDSNRTN